MKAYQNSSITDEEYEILEKEIRKKYSDRGRLDDFQCISVPNTGCHIQKPISSKQYGWRFCQDFWYKIYAKGGSLYNLDQNLQALIFTKTEWDYIC